MKRLRIIRFGKLWSVYIRELHPDCRWLIETILTVSLDEQFGLSTFHSFIEDDL